MQVRQNVLYGLLIGCAVVVLVGRIATTLYSMHPASFDRGSHVFTVVDSNAIYIAVDLGRRHGMKPKFQINTPLVKRAMFADGTVINWVDPTFLAQLGNTSSAIMFVADEPTAAAERDRQFLREKGIQLETQILQEPGAPPNSVVLAKNNLFLGTLIGYRRRVDKMGPRPPKWPDN